MGKIKILPPDVVTKIAAGEVIERPSYAVKELIDNSIDAKATKIKINIFDSGLRRIEVFDNGVGMTKEDVNLSVIAHTTSKIFNENDLVGISTLGFRGEAISSISAISQLTLQSKPKGVDSGSQIKISFGEITKKGSLGMAQGTKIIVENLFSNVPARKKFLKSARTEFRHILDTVIYFSLAYPNISFTLSHNGKQIFSLEEKDSLLNRIDKIFGSNQQGYIPIKHTEGYLAIEGYIGHPQISSYSSQKLLIYVNKRKIQNSLIASSVKEAYSNLLDHNSYPTGILFLNLPYEVVDVNVHPRKEEVAFFDPQGIYTFINSSIKETLVNNNLTFFNVSWQQKLTDSKTAAILKEEIKESELLKIGKQTKLNEVIQIHNTYLISESERGVLLVDQHAAHESLLYRELLNVFNKKRVQTKLLAKPIIIDLSPSDFEILIEHKKLFSSLGFIIEEFGNNSIKLTAIPQLFEDRNIKDILFEISDNIRDEKIIKNIDQKTNLLLATIACKSAIKAGDRLDKDQIMEIMQKLSETDMVYTCPHGRPVKIDIPLSTLARWMKRA